MAATGVDALSTTFYSGLMHLHQAASVDYRKAETNQPAVSAATPIAPGPE